MTLFIRRKIVYLALYNKKGERLKLILLIMIFIFNGCGQTNSLLEPNNKNESNLTIGVVQKEIHIGMTQADVASVLGSPNIVSSVERDKETWIYDKISSNISYKNSNSYATILIISGEENQGNSSYSQKSLTVIIKFIKGKVNEFKYHTTRY